jgi:hypothetical protein
MFVELNSKMWQLLLFDHFVMLIFAERRPTFYFQVVVMVREPPGGRSPSRWRMDEGSHCGGQRTGWIELVSESGADGNNLKRRHPSGFDSRRSCAALASGSTRAASGSTEALSHARDGPWHGSSLPVAMEIK